MKITPEMFGLTKEEVAKQEALDKRIAKLYGEIRKPITNGHCPKCKALFVYCLCYKPESPNSEN